AGCEETRDQADAEDAHDVLACAACGKAQNAERHERCVRQAAIELTSVRLKLLEQSRRDGHRRVRTWLVTLVPDGRVRQERDRLDPAAVRDEEAEQRTTVELRKLAFEQHRPRAHAVNLRERELHVRKRSAFRRTHLGPRVELERAEDALTCSLERARRTAA